MPVEEVTKLRSNRRKRGFRWAGVGFAVVVFAVSLAVRGYRLAEIQPHHDEVPIFGSIPGEPLEWTGSVDKFLNTIAQNAIEIGAADSPPVVCLVAELFRLVVGENLAAARWFHAIIYSLGVALLAWLAWRIYHPLWAPSIGVAILATFSVAGIYFGQFGEMYAIFFLASVVQLLAYWLILKGRYTRYRYGGFILVAIVCSCFEYLQSWLTLGLLLATVLPRSRLSRCRRLVRTGGALLLYGFLNVLPLLVFFGVPREEARLTVGYRSYYERYYPPRNLNVGEMGVVVAWAKYYVVQTYDLFNYFMSMAFNPRLYQPREWNWLSLPFIILIGLAVSRSFRRGRSSSSGVLVVVVSALLTYIAGNAFCLLPYGGVRNSLYIAPLIWLAYGEIVVRLGYPRITRRRLRVLILTGLVLLPLVPFIFSLPGFYRDRVSRFDPEKLGRLIKEYHPDTIIMPEPTYSTYRMILQNHPGFEDKYIHPLDVTVTSFFEFSQSWPRPVPGKKVMALDFFLSADGQYEGPGIKDYHISLSRLAETEAKFKPVLEIPGNSIQTREHMSIYFPPNSFFVYYLDQGGEGEK